LNRTGLSAGLVQRASVTSTAVCRTDAPMTTVATVVSKLGRECDEIVRLPTRIQS
jgi:hypothetical protein